ncbi:MAG: cellulose synthase [Streptosporangiales bacterium]|nr:cellulose synthase [Streptosporangiales bacterium]
MPYDLWIPLGGTLTLLGLIASWIVWRRRGAAPGMRLAAWALLPLAAALIGVLGLIWTLGTTLVGFFTRLVFSPLVWIGVALAGVAILLWLLSGVLRARGVGTRTPAKATTTGDTAPITGESSRPVAGGTPAPTSRTGAADDDLGDIEEILKRRGIS